MKKTFIAVIVIIELLLLLGTGVAFLQGSPFFILFGICFAMFLALDIIMLIDKDYKGSKNE